MVYLKHKWKILLRLSCMSPAMSTTLSNSAKQVDKNMEWDKNSKTGSLTGYCAKPFSFPWVPAVHPLIIFFSLLGFNSLVGGIMGFSILLSAEVFKHNSSVWFLDGSIGVLIGLTISAYGIKWVCPGSRQMGWPWELGGHKSLGNSSEISPRNLLD